MHDSLDKRTEKQTNTGINACGMNLVQEKHPTSL